MNFYQIKRITKSYKKILNIIKNKNSKKISDEYFDNLIIISSAIEDTMEELNDEEYEIIRNLYLKNKNRHTIEIENYVSETWVYRLINKFNSLFYIKICKNEELKKSALYVINRLQN